MAWRSLPLVETSRRPPGFAQALPLAFPPPQGRAIAYGNSGVPSGAWDSVARGGCCRATESDQEQTRIETRTAVAHVRCVPLPAPYCAAVFSICDGPAPSGEG